MITGSITSEISVARDEGSLPVQARPTTWQQFKALFLIAVRAPKMLAALLENQSRIAQAIGTNAAVLNQLAARIAWYEHRVPFIRKEYLEFKRLENERVEKVKAAANYEEREKRRAEMAVAR